MKNKKPGAVAKRPTRRTKAAKLDERALWFRITDLRDDVIRHGSRRFEEWHPSIVRRSFLLAAKNLAHYLALRAHDLSGIQVALSEHGLSSLGRCEPHVLSSLDAVMEALGRISGHSGKGFPPAGWNSSRAVTLTEQSEAIFGPDPTGPRSRIMVTLGTESASDPSIVRDMIAAGADCARINCAHDDAETWQAMISNVRLAARMLKRDCRVVMDLAGPKVRVASVRGPGKHRLNRGDEFDMVQDDRLPADKGVVTITCSGFDPVARLKVGQQMWIDDGKIGAVVVERVRQGVRFEVKHVRPTGARVKVGKGLNFPDLDLDIPSLTEKDLKDLDFVATNADIIGLSFVQRPKDIAWLQQELAKRVGGRPLPPLIIKVETRLGVANLPDLMVQAAGRQPTAVMIARGDLAVELGLQHLSEVQEQLLWLCEAAHIPVVWATQVLDGLVKTGMPSRAETTDAAMGQRAECVMLNKGPHVVEAVRFLDNVMRRMDKHVNKKSPLLGPLSVWSERVSGEAKAKSQKMVG